MMMLARKPRDIPGKLIAVEGLDGSGKSTQIYLVKRWLEMQDMKVFFTEWNSSALVKKVTKLGKKEQLLTPTTFSLIHCTDFADRYERQIWPLLRAGFIVLADRYMYTAFARDVVRGCSHRWVRNLYGFAVEPDITFFFKVPLETALDRILSGRPQLKYFEAGMDLGLSSDPYESFRMFQQRIHRQYETMEDIYHFHVVDATQTVEEQQQEVRENILAQLDLPRFKKHARIRML
jgi:dTMP kinase